MFSLFYSIIISSSKPVSKLFLVSLWAQENKGDSIKDISATANLLL